ncbi:MAG TPA: hypothetical protein VFW94_06305 [Candidatus Acidoferrales bacterium]|nr:hypothetical protein [Candidatus Acidoferrales bacterium]
MVSSKTSDLAASRASAHPRPPLDLGRFRGHRGGLISTHRALARFVLNPLDLVVSVALVAFLSVLWLVLLPFVCRFWRVVFARGARMLALNAAVGITDRRFTAYFHLSVPYPRVESIAPTSGLWWATALAVLLLLGASFLLKNNYIPFAYLIRAALCVQVSALAYFAWSPAAFPHTSSGYLEGLVGYGIVLISIVPALFGFTYFIFDFGLFRKVLLTLMTMLHLCLFIPLQALLHAVILQKSILFMPVLYIIFGLPLDILVVIAFYSWGMSWSS